MAAIGTTRAQRLITQAAQAGLTAEQIARHVGTTPDYLDMISGAAEGRIEQLITDHQHRQQVIDRVVHLAGLDGRDQQVVRTNAQTFPTAQLEQIAAEADAKLRRKGIDTRTPAERQADAEYAEARASSPATDRQVAYLVKLLGRSRRSGEGGGFISTQGLYTADGGVNLDALRQLTVQQASNLIDSLKGGY